MPYGQTTTFLDNLYEELLTMGHAHDHLQGLSVSQALLARYGSGEAVDQAVAPGTFQGVKQPTGGLASWRKLWGNVHEEKEAIRLARTKATDTLIACLEECMAVGIPDSEIRSLVDAQVRIKQGRNLHYKLMT